MWSTEAIPDGDPLRQGDLLEDVPFVMLKSSLPIIRPEGSELAVLPVKRKWGLVVSQCCDNEAGNYASIAWVTPQGRMTDEQAAALANPDPTDLEAGYTYGQFQLEPLDEVLVPRKPGSPFVAELERATPFWGEVADTFVPLRRGRMTPEARMTLRAKLALLWGRIEAEDAAHLRLDD